MSKLQSQDGLQLDIVTISNILVVDSKIGNSNINAISQSTVSYRRTSFDKFKRKIGTLTHDYFYGDV